MSTSDFDMPKVAVDEFDELKPGWLFLVRHGESMIGYHDTRELRN